MASSNDADGRAWGGPADVANWDSFDMYEALEIAIDFPNEKIKQHFSILTKKYHPDRNPAYEERFKEITKAYSYLSIPAARTAYDLYRQQGETTYEDENHEDLFDDFAKEATSSNAGESAPLSPQKGADICIDIHVPYSLAYTGGIFEITYVNRWQQHQTMKMKIPKRHKSGKKIVFSGLGFAGKNKGLQGDLVVTTFVKEPKVGANVSHRIEISSTEAARGCIKELAFTRKKTKFAFKLKVPAGVIDSTTIRARGKGFSGDPGTPPGDALIEIKVMRPKVGDDVYGYAIYTLRNWLKWRGSSEIYVYDQDTHQAIDSLDINILRSRRGIQRGSLIFFAQAPSKHAVDIRGDLHINVVPSNGLLLLELSIKISVIAYLGVNVFRILGSIF